MDKDIVPELLETIQVQFDERTYNSAKLKKALKLLEDKTATYLTANDFAIELGEILADVLNTNITAEVLPDGKMYFNIADRIINPMMQKNYDLISGFNSDVQSLLNAEAGLKLKAQVPALNQDRIDGIVNRVSRAEDIDVIKWILNEPIVNFSQNIVDDSVKANADFHFNAGLSPKITRRLLGDACDWCKSLAGTYDYHDEPADFYRRHERCRCTVEYSPKDGRGIQNSHTKKWREEQKRAKIELRKQIGLRQEDIQLPKSVSAKAKDIFVRKDFGVKRHPLDDEISYKIKPGSTIKSVEIIGGKGVKRQIDDINRLVRENPGSLSGEWQKVKGNAELLNLDGKYLGWYEVHWYQNSSVGKVEFKVKTR